jgi:fused signal recognition particle receptor
MYPQLMGAAGQWREGEPGETGRASHHPPGRHRRQPVGVRLHPPAALLIEPTERQVDGSRRIVRAAFDHRPVGLADLAVLEQKAQMSEGLAVAAEHQAARGVLVEAVGQRRWARQAESQGIEMVFEAGATLGAAMDRQAGGLVHHHHQPVTVEDAPEEVGGSNGFKLHDETAITAADMNDSASEGSDTTRQSWWSRLRGGLSRTTTAISTAITGLVSKRKLDAAVVEELEETLIRADFGIDVAARLAGAVGEGRYDKMITPDEVKGILADEIEKILLPVTRPLVIDDDRRPFVILVAGVNGSGKTTTIGKLAARLSREGRRVMLAAGDTFRAAAIEQLRIWGERTATPVIAGAQGSDAAGLAFAALEAARARGADVLIIDTAGRLQNKAGLMDELQKIIRVMKKLDPAAPHASLLVLDATIGQNALSQVGEFSRIAGITGLVMTKLDGTARGGILAAIADRYRIPVHFIGVGEGVDDLAPFGAREFARALAGLERP